MIAVVTGAAKGIGRAIALDLAAQGATVVVHYRHSAEAAKQVLHQVQIHAPASRMMQADLRHNDEVTRLFQAIHHTYGRLDVLINTIGSFGVYHPISQVTLEEFDDVISSNVRATLACMQAAIPLLRTSGGGRIINFGCVTAEQTLARKYTVPYYIAKAGVITLTKSYASLLAHENITVNCMSPGIVENSLVTQALPMQHPAKFEDITTAVRWLISPEAKYVSGANLEIAGGWSPNL
ncbi:MAG: SDR family oxidoreductase [Patescibacteria group bacterium]|jgi:NAD(P)-dependent dehydrogenase (short-subunit alcohol dehydrogenase family)